MEQGEPKSKKFKHSIISEHVFEAEFQEIFYKHWHKRQSIKTPDLEVIAEPFRICRISNFIKNKEFMDKIKNELIDVKSRRNSLDLYQFEQSNDLSKVDRKNLKTLYETFQTDLVHWMEKNTEIELNKKISMSSSCYSDTDFLLCHDDNLADRRIAFIMYLSEDWSEECGGALDLFDSDENGLPRNVVKSLIPEFNSLVFFEVVHNSYHQVAEITSPEKSRWSINGWLHGPVVLSKKIDRPEPIINYIEPESTETDLNKWISKTYLRPRIMKEIQEDVEQESLAFLSNFLKPDVYEKISKELEYDSIVWKKVGPADERNYEIAEENSLPEALANFYKMFKSITVFQLLKNYTELDLIPEKEGMNPKMTIELQRWSKGCYTLISDKSTYDESIINSSEKKSSANENCSGESSTPSKAKNLRQQKLIEKSDLSSSKIASEEIDCNTPPSSQSEDDCNGEKDVIKKKSKGKSLMKGKKKISVQQQTPPRSSHEKDIMNYDSDDSSDFGDSLTDPQDCSFEYSDREDEVEDDTDIDEPGSLDLIMQFHTNRIVDEETIDYVDLREEDGALINVPSKENHLCLVYKTIGTCRLHKYVNHYCKGYFYNLVCTYFE